MDIQPVFNKYKAVTYMCQYFSKTDNQCSQAMQQAAKEAYENNTHHHDELLYFARIKAKENLSSCVFFGHESSRRKSSSITF